MAVATTSPKQFSKEDMLDARNAVDSSQLLPLEAYLKHSDESLYAASSERLQQQRDALITEATMAVLRIGLDNVHRIHLMPDAATTGYAADVQGAAYVVRPSTPASAVVGAGPLADNFCGVQMTFEIEASAAAKLTPAEVESRLFAPDKKAPKRIALEAKLVNFDDALALQRAGGGTPGGKKRGGGSKSLTSTTSKPLSGHVIGTTSTSIAVQSHQPVHGPSAMLWRIIVRCYDAQHSRRLRKLAKGGATVEAMLREQDSAIAASKYLVQQLAIVVSDHLKLPEGALRRRIDDPAQIGGVVASHPDSTDVYNVFGRVREGSGKGEKFVVYYNRAFSLQLSEGAIEFGRGRALGHVSLPGSRTAPVWSSAKTAHAFPIGRPRLLATRAVPITQESVVDAAAAERVAYARVIDAQQEPDVERQPFSVKLSSRPYVDLGDELQSESFLAAAKSLGWPGGTARIWVTQAAFISAWTPGRDIDRDELAQLLAVIGGSYQFSARIRRATLLEVLASGGADAQDAYGARIFAAELEDQTVELSGAQVIALAKLLPQQ